jgi:hypothetical protein
MADSLWEPGGFSDQPQQVAECMEAAEQQAAADGAQSGGNGDADGDTQQQEQEQAQQPQWPAALLGRPQQQQQQAEQAQSMHHGGSFKTYMAHKNLKLAEQFEMQVCATAHGAFVDSVGVAHPWSSPHHTNPCRRCAVWRGL